MSQDNFQIAHKFAARWEGGLIDHPADPGGITNYGVSLRFVEAHGLDINGDGFIDRRDILALTPAKAADVLRKYFWDAARLDAVPLTPGVVLYDGGINQGMRLALIQMQAACNAVSNDAPLYCDGVMGSQTRAKIAAICALGRAPALVERALIERAGRYRRIVRAAPQRAAFLDGWLNRVNALSRYVAGLS